MTDTFSSWLVANWGVAVARSVCPPEVALPSDADVLGAIDCGLLAWPYVEVYRDGRKLPYDTVFAARTVQNHRVSGFVHHRNTMDQLRHGATVRLPAIEDWLPVVRPLVSAARAALECEVEVSAYLVTGGSTVAIPRSQGDTVAIVCSGSVSWSTGERVEAGPRDVAHWPAGTSPDVVAGDAGCLLLVLADREPSTREFVKALQDAGVAHLERQAAMTGHHLMTVEEKADWVRGELRTFFASMDADELLRTLTARA